MQEPKRSFFVFVTSFLGFGFIFYNAFPDFELGASKVIVDKHNYHMKEIVLGRHWVSAHMIDLMDIYNTSIVIRNRNFQAQANVDARLAIVDDFAKERQEQIVQEFEKNGPEWEAIDKSFMELQDAEKGFLEMKESLEVEDEVNLKINIKKNEMLAVLSMEEMKFTSIHDEYDSLWKEHHKNELKSLPIHYDQSLLAKSLEDRFESIMIKLERINEIQALKNQTEEATVETIDEIIE